MKIEFENGSSINSPDPEEGVTRGMGSKNIQFLKPNGEVEATIPNDNELLHAIIGYEHDPETHNYNRAERRRIIKAAQELEKKYRKFKNVK